MLMSFCPCRNSPVFSLIHFPLETEVFGEGEICERGWEVLVQAEQSVGAVDVVCSEAGKKS